MAAPRAGTRERILDAAEELFAAKGFDGTSTRDIVERSGDTIGSVNYHFGSKGQLLVEVVRRRWDMIQEERTAAFASAARRSTDVPGLEDTIAAFMVPFLKRSMSATGGWRSYIHLLIQLAHSRPLYELALAEISEPVVREFIRRLQAAMPQAAIEDLGYAYQFMLGAMLHSAADVELGRLRRITDGACHSDDFDALTSRIVRFVAAGIREIAGSRVGHDAAPEKVVATARASGQRSRR